MILMKNDNKGETELKRHETDRKQIANGRYIANSINPKT